MATNAKEEHVSLGDLHVARSHVDLLNQHGLTSLHALMNAPGSAQLDKPGLPSWRQRLKLELRGDDGQTVTLFLKRYRSPPPRVQRERSRASGRGHSMAWIEWQWAWRLGADGVLCAEPVAFGERIDGNREQCSAFIMASAAGESMERWADQRSDRCPRELLVALANFVRRFHGAGYVHRDLYLCHLFVDLSAHPEAMFRLIDLQRVMQPRFFRERWRIKDLAALNYSTPTHLATAVDRVRFLRLWMGTRRLGNAGKRLARGIIAKTDRIRRHDGRRRVRLASEGVRSETRGL